MATWHERDLPVRRIMFTSMSALDEADLHEVGAMYYQSTDGKIRLDRGTDFIDIPTYPNVPRYLDNMFLTATVNDSAWTGHGDWDNAHDGNETTAADTAYRQVSAAGTLGYLEFDMGAKHRVLLAAKLGMWSSNGGVDVYWQYKSDSGSWYYVSESTVPSTAVVDVTSEYVKFAKTEYVNARNVRLRFYGTAAMSAWVKIYEAYAWNLEQLETVTSTNPEPTNFSNKLVGWGGYLTSNNIENLVNMIWSTGCGMIRGWWVQDWYQVNASGWQNNSKSRAAAYGYANVDALVTATYSRGMIAILDCNHNFDIGTQNPDNDVWYKRINKSNHSSFRWEWMLVASRYRNYSHCILELVNEYDSTETTSLSTANSIIQYLRANDITAPILWNFWWDANNRTLADPLGYYYIGRHLYAQTPGNWSRADGYSFDTLREGTIENSMNTFWVSDTEYKYWQREEALNIPLGWFLSEVGAANSGTYLEAPRSGGICFEMDIALYAYSRKVPVIMYRIGAGNDSDDMKAYMASQSAASRLHDNANENMTLYPWDWTL